MVFSKVSYIPPFGNIAFVTCEIQPIELSSL